MKGNTPNEYIVDGQTGLLEGVASELPLGIGNVSLWRDGYWTAGKYLSVGSDIYGNAVIDISIPWFGGNTYGTITSINKQLWDNSRRYPRPIDNPVVPILPIPYYLTPILYPF